MKHFIPKPDKYNPEKIERIYNNLLMLYEAGTPRQFAIYLDDAIIIPKTDNIALFNRYKDFIDENSVILKINLFHKSSNGSERYEFNLMARTRMEAEELAGFNSLSPSIDVEKRIQEEIAKIKKEDLEKKLIEKTTLLEEAQRYIETLESEIETAKSNKFKLNNINIAELSGVALEYLIRNNTKLIGQLTGNNNLAGIIDNDTQSRMLNQEKQEDTKASFEKETNFDVSTPNFSDEVIEYAQFLEELIDKLDQEQTDNLISILNHLNDNPTQILTFKELI